jgi:hypothetical protein
MPLLKSDKARQELAAKQRHLTVRERSALFLADGVRTRDELVWLLQGDIGMVQKLMADGYLIPAETLSKRAATRLSDFAARPASSPAFASSRAASLSSPAPTSSRASSQTSAFAGLDAAIQVPPSSSDTFEGRRSLATTRMFLFDIVERMFVRKMPELANSLRDQLRGAKDRESMLVIAREIITNVEEIAGPDRADGLSERLAMMLPSEH